jgi:hypothetical protein
VCAVAAHASGGFPLQTPRRAEGRPGIVAGMAVRVERGDTTRVVRTIPPLLEKALTPYLLLIYNRK